MGDIIEIHVDDSSRDFDEYMSEPVRSLAINPFDWWKGNQSKFPKTSVPSERERERAINTAGLTITAQRCRLDPSVADSIIFLNKYTKSKLCPGPVTCAKAIIVRVKDELKESAEHAHDVKPPLPTAPSLDCPRPQLLLTDSCS